jgi:hypothetical protein
MRCLINPLPFGVLEDVVITPGDDWHDGRLALLEEDEVGRHNGAGSPDLNC